MAAGTTLLTVLLVTVPAAAQEEGSGTAAGDSALADTGSELSLYLLAALALIVVGMTAVVIARRRVRASEL